MRQAGRYMAEYRAVRKHHSLIEICKTPKLAAQVTIEAAEILGVDAAIIFADLLLPLEVMGLPFHFEAGEGPVIEKPLRTAEDVAALRTDRAADLGYVAESVRLVCEALRRQAAGDRLLRRAVHPGQLHDRRRRFAQLHRDQEDDVLARPGVGRADAQAGGRARRVFGRAGSPPAPTSSRFSIAGSAA